MSAKSGYLSQLRSYLQSCAAEADPAIHENVSSGQPIDREFALQLEVFEERFEQLQSYIERISNADESYWELLTSDADKACRALTVSLEYFRRSTRRAG